MGVIHFICRSTFLALSLISLVETWESSNITLYLVFVFGALYAHFSPPMGAINFRRGYSLFPQRCIPTAYLLKHLELDADATRSAFLPPGASLYFFIRVFDDSFAISNRPYYVKIRTLVT